MFSLHKISVVVLLLLLPAHAFAGNPYRLPAGASEMGMGSVCIIKPGFWSSFHNPGLLAENKSLSAGINYENRFFIPELGTGSFGLIMPAGKASMGLLYSHSGFPEFRRETAAVSCGLKLSENISGGVKIDYLSEKTTGEYDNNLAVTFETGLFIKHDNKVYAGIHIINPVPNSLRKSYMPSTIRIGAGIRLSEIVLAATEVELSSGHSLVVKCGFEYAASGDFLLRGGFSTENRSFSFGLGYILKSCKVDLGFATHERLGVRSSASIIFIIK